MVHGDAHSRLLEDIAAAEARIERYIRTNQPEWCDPYEHKLAGLVRELAELYDFAGVGIYDRRYSLEDLDAAFIPGGQS